MIKKILLLILVSIAVYAFIFLLQLWGTILPLDIFFKVSITFGALIFLEVISFGIFYAIKEDKELEKGGYLG